MLGESILHYGITDRIGAGGMGIAWRAFYARPDREVVLKILPEAATPDPSRHEWFLREAKAAWALNHPHIGTAYEINSDGPVHFIALEFAQERPLSQIMAEHRCLPAGIALESANPGRRRKGRQRGLVNRDMKPSRPQR